MRFWPLGCFQHMVAEVEVERRFLEHVQLVIIIYAIMLVYDE